MVRPHASRWWRSDAAMTTATAGPGPGTADVNLGTGDTGVLNYAYALEQLEAAFYTQVVASFYAGAHGRRADDPDRHQEPRGHPPRLPEGRAGQQRPSPILRWTSPASTSPIAPACSARRRRSRTSAWRPTTAPASCSPTRPTSSWPARSSRSRPATRRPSATCWSSANGSFAGDDVVDANDRTRVPARTHRGAGRGRRLRHDHHHRLRSADQLRSQNHEKHHDSRRPGSRAHGPRSCPGAAPWRAPARWPGHLPSPRCRWRSGSWPSALSRRDGLPQGIIDVLNFALTLEYLEDEFYRTGLDTGGLIPRRDLPIFQTISEHETAHVARWRACSAPTRSPSRPSTSPPAARSIRSATTRLPGAGPGLRGHRRSGLQGAGGGADGRTTTILTTALRIHSVEARHASAGAAAAGTEGLDHRQSDRCPRAGSRCTPARKRPTGRPPAAMRPRRSTSR